METESRIDWSRASYELCRASNASLNLRNAAEEVQRLQIDRHGLGDNDNHFDETERYYDAEEEIGPLLIESPPSYGYCGGIADGELGSPGSCKGNGEPGKVFRRESLSHILYDEIHRMVHLALPVIGTYLLEMFPGFLTIVLVGHIDSSHTAEYMDAAALSVMYVNLTGLSVGIGLASAMDTLCSQAYGAGAPHKMGIYFQTGLVVLSVAFIAIFFLNYYATSILIGLGQPIVVSELAGAFILYLIPSIPFLYCYELLRKVLQSQNDAMPMLYVSIIANVINAGLGYYLVYETQWNWLGAAVARTICNSSFFVLLWIYLWYTNSFASWWSGWRLRQALNGLKQFVALGIPGALQLCFEWWAFECLALISGLLPSAVLAIGANAILTNLSTMVYMLYLGVSIAGNVRIGNALGAAQPKRASLAALLTFGLAVCSSMLCAVLLLGFRKSMPYLFTRDADITSYTSQLLYVAAAFQLPDAINAAVQGIFRGSGRQSLGAYLNFVAYYVVGIPFGAVLAFHFTLSVMGLWIGMSLGLLVCSAVGIIVITRSDWSALSDDARLRLRSSNTNDNKNNKNNNNGT